MMWRVLSQTKKALLKFSKAFLFLSQLDGAVSASVSASHAQDFIQDQTRRA
jgi:hypothetical protein